MIECSKCGELCEPHRKKSRICRKCLGVYYRQYMKNYRIARPGIEMERYRRRAAEDPAFLEQLRQRGRKYWADLRHGAIMAYGGYRCACCGETEPKFLSLDHVFNDGSQHRKEVGGRGSQIFKWLRDHGYPAGFQVLCMNCNHGKALNGGVCPHKNKKLVKASLG